MKLPGGGNGGPLHRPALGGLCAEVSLRSLRRPFPEVEMSSRWSPAILAAAALASACVPALPAPEPASPAYFVTTLASDTVSVEALSIRGNRFEGRQVLRSPRTMLRSYSGTLDPQGAIETFQVEFETPGTRSATRGEIIFADDSATVRITQGDSVRSMRVAAPRGTLPLLSHGVALYELPLRRMQSAGESSLRAHLLPIGGQPIAYRIEAASAGEYRIDDLAGSNRVVLDGGGRLQRFDGRGSTMALVSERVPALDLPELTHRFIERDDAEGAPGVLSPRDSVTAHLHGATVSVDYGRPLKRGRQIWGALVPYGQLWRTGANQATHLRTTRDLEFGGTLVPAGSYTLWSIPTATGGQLVLNRQTGQWGTAHDPAHDLVRVPMRREAAAERLEQFTISLESTEAGGQIRLAWDDAAYVTPFRVR